MAEEYRLDIVTDPDPDTPLDIAYFTAVDADAAVRCAQYLLTTAAGPDDRYGELYVHTGTDRAVHYDTIHLPA
ncbi:hypothetical protein AWW66_22255 [Micromonospora rosaria]|uniref:Uncharacterized protein n=1 Tax=Micromonospora rosaria TaxID=47874 RepID=A0A136PN20_9ACTN|nr:hypothetical protein [Micromonospora rosaria]KXK59815.1 hypothetical protein AWW66_22255 [Micromonospora rosaria]